MRKNKLFIVLAVVTILTFLATAATCNLCGLVPPVETTYEESEEEDVSGGQRTETTSAKTEAEETEPSETEVSEEETSAEETEPEEAPPEEPIRDAGGEGIVFNLKVNKNLSGYVTEDGSVLTRSVFIGDNVSNKAVKGYISFDIRELFNTPIITARISITDIVAAVDPTFADQLIIKVFDYGSVLNASAFAEGGTHLAAFSTAGLTSINISGDNLKTLVEQWNNDGKDYFQLKLGLSSYTDNDGVADMFAINLDAAKLIVEQ